MGFCHTNELGVLVRFIHHVGAKGLVSLLQTNIFGRAFTVTIAFIPPPDHWPDRYRQRARQRLSQWAGDSEVRTFSDQGAIQRELAEANPQKIVFWSGFDISILPKTEARLYRVDPSGVIAPHDQILSEEDHPNLRNTTFGRLGGARDSEFKFFPYGLMGVHSGRGELDELGFRIHGNFNDLVEREAHQRVIAVYGGSTAFSTHCFDDETFASRLETILNQKAVETNNGHEYRVLNFGQVGAVTLHNIICWTLYGIHLKPEVVICHSGWNDLCLGLGCDPVLLAEYHISYLYQFEEWAKILHGTHEGSANPGRPLKILNAPEDVVEAWLSRIKQFADLVSGMGSQCFLGLQPAACSKSEMHPNEKAIIERGANNPDLRLAFEKMPALLDMASLRLEESDIDPNRRIDFHDSFRAYDGTCELFADRVHCWPEGDEIIARGYAELIWRS
ncbi:hypothetical protein SCOR_18970 [Sulfidibacter corallicola]